MVLDFKNSVVPLSRSNNLGNWVEDPLLGSLVGSVSSLSDIMVVVTLCHSVVWKLRSEIEWSIGE
jgi:hypothetical protein